MKLKYASEKVEAQCTSVKESKKLFGGDQKLAEKLLSRINALKAAETLNDIIIQPQFRFHNLKNKNGRDLDGFFAIDVKTRKDPWRIILQPLDDDEKPFVPCNIHEISSCVKIVEIREVSKHYE